MGSPRYRLAGSEGRPWCEKHELNCVMCWCGHLRADVAMTIDKAELVPMEAKEKPQESLFGQALREGAQP